MGKRSSFKRRPQDAYDTPREAVLPLYPYLPDEPFSYWEPCAGNGSLIDAMPDQAVVSLASDIMPRGDGIEAIDALSGVDVDFYSAGGMDMIITNPPWTREILHPMIEAFRAMAPTWLLFDADWMHTKQAAPYLPFCSMIVSVGRVKWIPGSPSTGKDNCCWYLFEDIPTVRLPGSSELSSLSGTLFCGRG